MAGKRILDAALLLGATRSVARQHVRVRAEQLDVWSKTSSLAKAIKARSERVTVTLQAANAVSKRVVDTNTPIQYTARTQQTQDVTIPRKETVEGATGEVTPQDAIRQDHHYERSKNNAVVDPPREQELQIKQEQPTRYPTADGSIPPDGAPVETTEPKPLNSDVTGKRIEQGVQEGVLEEQGHSQTKELNPAASSNSNIPEPGDEGSVRFAQQTQSMEEAVPADINLDVFRTPRVKKALGEVARRGVLETSKPSPRHEKISSTKPAAFTVMSHGVPEGQTVSPEVTGDFRTVASQPTPANVSKSSEDMESLAADIATENQSPSLHMTETPPAISAPNPSKPTYEMRESRVPSSRLGRLWQYGGLATSMAFGAVGESFRRATGGGTEGPLMLSGQNMERLVAKLSRMRGAALKLGQMMSFQDSKMLPAPIAEVLQRVQDNADYMPPSQRDRVLAADLGTDWRSLFASFDEKPIAAASIGQVHRAVLASTGQTVAVKVQYPGVAASISSDLNNLAILLTASRLLPKGLYLDKTIANARTELAWECDYVREAECQERFRKLLADESDVFTVPRVVPEASGKQVLTAEFMSGAGVTKAAKTLPQTQRDYIGTQILRLCLRELTEFRFMQTDPNWTNFLYNPAGGKPTGVGTATTGKLELLDFGAARDFPRAFVDPYVRLLVAASKGDRAGVRALSVQLGYLTGHESPAMVNAHLASVMVLAEPFGASGGGGEGDVYDFAAQTITDRVRAQIPVMLRERLAPPPEETYSLHRKLSGAFLMLARLGSRVRCREMFEEAVGEWEAAGVEQGK